jgi:hypothetical protein
MDTSEPMGEEQCTYKTGDRGPVSLFDNCRCREPVLSHISFFTYCMLVQTKPEGDAVTADVDFDAHYPKSGLYIQHQVIKRSQVATITFNGHSQNSRLIHLCNQSCNLKVAISNALKVNCSSLP